MKKWLITTVVLASIVSLGYLFRVELILQGISLTMGFQNKVSEHRAVNWSRATPTSPEISTSKSTGVKSPASRKPNIILIVADDLGWNDLTINGGVAGGSVPTPSIDSIAGEGVSFSNGYSASGTCAPSRAALMTGKYPTRFGFEFTPTPAGMLPLIAQMTERETGPRPITYFDDYEDAEIPSFQAMGLPTEETTLAETLKDNGYHTVHIGKWHLGRTNGKSPRQQGFDESLLMASGLYLPEDDPNVVNSRQDYDPIDRFQWAAYQHAASFNDGDRFKPGGYLTDYYTDEAVKVIGNNRDRPFFLYLAHWAPHTPLQALRADYEALAHIGDHKLRVYAAMIRALDRSVGRVLQALKDNGLDENTLVLFTSDNGGAGYVGIPDVNAPFRGWKITFFEGGIHVPYMARWPGKIPANTRYDKPVHHFDIFATVTGAAQIPADPALDGVNLLPYLAGNEAEPHEALFWRGGHYQVVISDGWKLQQTARPDKRWLFHLSTDPNEQNNVADDNPEQVQKLQALLQAHNAEQVPPAWPGLLEAPILIDKTSDLDYEDGDEYIYWLN